MLITAKQSCRMHRKNAFKATYFLSLPRAPQTTVPSIVDDDRGWHRSFFFVSLHAVLWQACCSVFLLSSFYPSDDIQLKCLFTVKVVAAVVFPTDWLVSRSKTYTHKKQKGTSFKGWRGYPFLFCFLLFHIHPAGRITRKSHSGVDFWRSLILSGHTHSSPH